MVIWSSCFQAAGFINIVHYCSCLPRAEKICELHNNNNCVVQITVPVPGLKRTSSKRFLNATYTQGVMRQFKIAIANSFQGNAEFVNWEDPTWSNFLIL